jgi:hypothetical protein
LPACFSRCTIFCESNLPHSIHFRQLLRTVPLQTIASRGSLNPASHTLRIIR